MRKSAILGWVLAAFAAGAEAPFIFGQSCPLDGPARALGEGMRAGVLAAFHEINAAGGVHGRALELISRNDGYEPAAAAANAWELIHKENVFALIGCVGTPTTRAVRAVARHEKVPIVGPFTGAAGLRRAPFAEVLNVRASYAQEIERIVAEFVDTRGRRRIACLYQNDAFGLTCIEDLEDVLARRGLTPVAMAPFERNTTAVKAPFLAIRRAEPDAIILFGTYSPCAKFVRLVRQFEMDALLASVSFIGVDEFAAELGTEHPECYVTQVVPGPDSAAPVAQAFRAAAAGAGAPVNYVALEGYIAGHFAAAALRKAGPGAGREAFAAAALTLTDVDFHGLRFQLGAADNQALDDVYLTVVRHGRIEEFAAAPEASHAVR